MGGKNGLDRISVNRGGKLTGDLYQKHLYQKHKGILVDTYVYSDGSQVTAFKWEKQ